MLGRSPVPQVRELTKQTFLSWLSCYARYPFLTCYAGYPGYALRYIRKAISNGLSKRLVSRVDLTKGPQDRGLGHRNPEGRPEPQESRTVSGALLSILTHEMQF